MDTTEVRTLLEDLGGNIDDLESSLEPLIKASLSTTTSRLPLLDKAKLYVLATYAIESILFSYLRLNGVDAKEHAVFRELTRVKEYFDKVKAAEAGPVKRSTVLDKGAATRFIKHGLAGNDRYDQEHTARDQGAASKRKAEELEQTSQWGSHNRFESTAKRMRAQEPMVTVVKANEASEDEIAATEKESSMSKEERKAARRQRRIDARLAKQSPASDPSGVQDDDKDAAEPVRAAKVPLALHANSESLVQDQAAYDQTSKKKRKRKSRGDMRRELEDKRAQEMT